MTATIKNDKHQDYYLAHLENNELIMEPFCACGNALNEDYYCERCRRKCRCDHVLCQDKEALARIRSYIRQSGKFSGFSAALVEKT